MEGEQASGRAGGRAVRELWFWAANGRRRQRVMFAPSVFVWERPIGVSNYC